MENRIVRIKPSTGMRRHIGAFQIVNAVILIGLALVCLFPMYYVLVGSFNEGENYALGGVALLPRLWSVENFKWVLGYKLIWNGFLITIARTVVGTVLHLVVTLTVAYGMSHSLLKGRTVFWAINIFTMFFGGGIIPFYILLTEMRLTNTFWVYVIPGVYSVYNMLVFQTFIRQQPPDIHDAAIIDGCGEWRYLFQFVFALSKPVLATVGLWTVVGHWNSYFDTMYYCDAYQNLWTLQYVLKDTIESGNMLYLDGKELNTQTVGYAAIIVATLPVLVVYPFLQRYFVSGFMIGSLKG